LLSVESFRILDKEIWIGVIFDEKIDAISFSLDGEEFLRERIHSAKVMLERRRVLVELTPKKSEYPKLIYEILRGKIENSEALKHLSFRGVTPFERKVYETLTLKVKRGQTITYGGLARLVKTSPRAIGNAMRRNPYPIIVPCHRIVLKSDLGNYTPKREYKEFLLKLEGVL
jgi:methylated-DNA-[protein]-cysteine S-methyltransferase